MLHDLGEGSRPATVATTETPRVKVVACLGGVSLERDIPPEEIHAYLGEDEAVVWVDVASPGPDEVALLIEELGLHPLGLEDADDPGRRPRADELKGYLRLVTHAAVPPTGESGPSVAAVDLFIGRHFLATIHRARVPALEEALARWIRGGPMLREGVGFLVYEVLDAIVDSFAPVIARIEEEIDEIEVALLAHPDEEAVRALLRLKRELAALRRSLYPLRSVFQVLLRPDHPFFPGNLEVHLREVLAHVLRLLDDLDAQREMASGALEASLAINANRLNRTMKTLAVITVAVAVVGSVFGAYGMNFEGLPLASSPWGFWVVCLGTTALVAAALWVSRRFGWW